MMGGVVGGRGIFGFATVKTVTLSGSFLVVGMRLPNLSRVVAQVSDGDVDEVSVVVFPFGCFDVAVVEFEQVRFCVALNADALVVLFGKEVEVEIDYVV